MYKKLSVLYSLIIWREVPQIIDWSYMTIEVLKSSPLHFIQILDQKKFDSIKKSRFTYVHCSRFRLAMASSHEFGWISPCVRVRNFCPVSEMRIEKRPKILGTISGAKFEKQSWTWRNKKILTFAPIIASATLKTVSLQ